ncbi:MAG: C-terminal binding protein [Armatimonadetes bacterium]|nr:C-terminal binding protein [Armatimonadota bacterium]MDW8029352.1 C-terminal binding protein [Armatimonadota bacterium]
MPIVVITDAEFEDLSWEREFFAQNGIDLKFANTFNPEEALPYMVDADVVVTNRCPILRPTIEQLRNCKAIIRYGVGYDNVDVKAATERGIIVCNVPDYCTHDVATHAVGLLLCCWRKIHFGDLKLKVGEWQRYKAIAPVFRTIGKTVGLFGFGRIGKRVSGLLYPFGFKIIACDPYLPEEEFLLHGAERVDFDALLERSDAISLHAPLTEETKGIFNRKAFLRMKKGIIFVNTARGGLVDEEALLWALDEGIVAAAGLDVFVNEPNPNPKLIQHPKVIATPHWAWYSEEAIWDLRRKVVEQALQAIKGECPTYAVNRKEIESQKS